MPVEPLQTTTTRSLYCASTRSTVSGFGAARGAVWLSAAIDPVGVHVPASLPRAHVHYRGTERSTCVAQTLTLVTSVNIHEAKTHLSRLVDRASKGREFMIAKAGKPALARPRRLLHVMARHADESTIVCCRPPSTTMLAQ